MTNTNANKVTKLQKFEMLRNWITEIENAAIDESIELTEGQPEELTMLIEFIDREMELLRNKRNKASGKPTKSQKENEGVKEQILETLAAGRMTATEVGNALGISVQKASALLRQLKEENKVVRIEEKKKVYFELPAEGAEPAYVDAAELLDADEADSEELETE
jgi:DNA-binding transcriptional ArsR family regulator